MKKMKKICYLFMSVVMTVLSLTACIRPTEPTKDEETGTANESTVLSETVVESETDADVDVTQEFIQAPVMTKDEYPKVDGSTATIPLSQALYRIVTGATDEEAQKEITHTKTTNAYYMLIYGYTDLVIAYEADPKIADAVEQEGVELDIRPIGKDAIVFLANSGNPINSLTSDQIVDIYSGKIRNWSDVGGEDKEIVAFQRPSGSGSQTMMEKLVMKGAAMDDAPSVLTASEMDELIYNVASYSNDRNALGYSVYFYARNMYKEPQLKFMAVDGTEPDNTTIKSGEYPYVNDFYAAVRKDEPKDSNAYKLFEWLTSEDGQSLIEELGYVGVGAAGKKLGTLLEDDNVKLEAEIRLPENTMLMFDSQILSGEDGVSLLDSTLKTVKKYNNIRLLPETHVILHDVDKPVAVQYTKDLKCGIYDLKNDIWIVDPKYDFITLNADGYYYGSTYLGDDKKSGKNIYNIDNFDSMGNLIMSHGNALDINYSGEYIWIVSLDTMGIIAEIYKHDGTYIKTLNMPEDYWYGYTHGNYLIADLDSGLALYSNTGELILNTKDYFDTSNVYIDGIASGGEWILVRYDDNDYIYDIGTQRFVTEMGDKIIYPGFENDDSYIIEHDGIRKVYNAEHEVMMSSDNIPYSLIINDGYFGYKLNGKLIIENQKTGYKMETDTVFDDTYTYVEHISGEYFYTSSADTAYLFKGNDMILKGEYINCSLVGEYHVIKCWLDDAPEKENLNVLILNHEGKEIYNTYGDADLLFAFDKNMILTEGNYIDIINEDGKYAFHQLSGAMSDD